MADELIEPKDETQVSPEQAVSPDGETPPSSETPQIPDALLKIPAIQGILAGQPPAVSAPIEQFKKTAAGKLIAENGQALQQAGMGFYVSHSGKIAVMFNALHVHPQEIQAADKAGQLLKIAPPFSVVNHQISKMGPADHPALNPLPTPGGPKGPPVLQPPVSTNMVAPPSSGIGKKLLTARLTNLQGGSPSQGPNAGQGALLRQILKPVI